MLGGEESRHRWLPDLAAGRIAATTALWNANDAADVTATLRADREPDGGWRLTGTADFVNDADTADVVVVIRDRHVRPHAGIRLQSAGTRA